MREVLEDTHIVTLEQDMVLVSGFLNYALQSTEKEGLVFF